jgi:drug/metabolite transporter (DMT)-like permease
MNDQTKGILFGIFGVLFIAPDSLFIRLISADVYTIIFWRSFCSGMLILLGLLIYHHVNIVNVFRGIGKNALWYGFFLAISGPMFALSVNLTAVSNTVFIVATMPVFSAISSWFLIGERISRRMVWTILFALFGIGIIAFGSAHNEATSLWGDLFAVGCAASFGVGLTFARKSKTSSMIPVTPFALIISSFFFLPFATPFVFNGNDASLVLMHNVLIAISTCFIAISPRYITSAEVAILILGESILAPILVWAFIGENPGPWALLGGGIVLGTLFISNMIALRKRRDIAA